MKFTPGLKTLTISTLHPAVFWVPQFHSLQLTPLPFTGKSPCIHPFWSLSRSNHKYPPSSDAIESLENSRGLYYRSWPFTTNGYHRQRQCKDPGYPIFFSSTVSSFDERTLPESLVCTSSSISYCILLIFSSAKNVTSQVQWFTFRWSSISILCSVSFIY